MITESHSVIFDQIHKGQICLTQILVEVECSGEHITRIEKNRVFCSRLSSFDCCYTAQDVVW
ncbi:hypothetical protein D3C78_1101060 [compost metagenome]